jgi:hypothetical protein
LHNAISTYLEKNDILNHIFTKIYDYSCIEIKRKGSSEKINILEKYTSSTNKNSTIYVINTENSNVSSISNGQEYLNNIFRMLYEQYGLEPHKASIYYLFDRDKGSNSETIIKELLMSLKNSLDNGENANGLLLLSFPCIESFIISCYEDNCKSLTISSKKIKRYLSDNHYQQHRLSSDHIIRACNEMITSIAFLINHELITSDIDDFGDLNLLLFEKQEEMYSLNRVYNIMSLLIISFIDLKLVSIE